MKAILLVIGFLLLSSWALASEGTGGAPVPSSGHGYGSLPQAITKADDIKSNSDNIAAIASSVRSTLKELNKTLKELDGPDSKSWWEKLWTDPNETFSGFVAIFTLGLVIVGILQVTQMRKTLEATLKTAEATLATAEATKASGKATELLAEATLKMESALIVVQKAKMVETGNESEEIITSALEISPFMRIPVKNIGRTPAFLNDVFVLIRVLKELPETPDYLPVKFKIPNGVVLAPGDFNSIQKKYFHIESGTGLVLGGKMSLWAYGYVAYRDFIGREHKTGFCYRWYPPDQLISQGRWEYEGPESYLYII